MSTESMSLQPIEKATVEAPQPDAEAFRAYADQALAALDDVNINPDPIEVEYAKDAAGNMQHIGIRSISKDPSVIGLFTDPRSYIFEQLDKYTALQNPNNPRYSLPATQQALHAIADRISKRQDGTRMEATMQQIVMGTVDTANRNPDIAARYKELVGFGIKLGKAMFAEAKIEDFYRSSPSTTPADRGFNDREVRALSNVLQHSLEAGEGAVSQDASVHVLGRSVIGQTVELQNAA